MGSGDATLSPADVAELVLKKVAGGFLGSFLFHGKVRRGGAIGGESVRSRRRMNRSAGRVMRTPRFVPPPANALSVQQPCKNILSLAGLGQRDDTDECDLAAAHYRTVQDFGWPNRHIDEIRLLQPDSTFVKHKCFFGSKDRRGTCGYLSIAQLPCRLISALLRRRNPSSSNVVAW